MSTLVTIKVEVTCDNCESMLLEKEFEDLKDAEDFASKLKKGKVALPAGTKRNYTFEDGEYDHVCRACVQEMKEESRRATQP